VNRTARSVQPAFSLICAIVGQVMVAALGIMAHRYDTRSVSYNKKGQSCMHGAVAWDHPPMIVEKGRQTFLILLSTMFVVVGAAYFVWRYPEPNEIGCFDTITTYNTCIETAASVAASQKGPLYKLQNECITRRNYLIKKFNCYTIRLKSEWPYITKRYEPTIAEIRNPAEK
jgi:hypothetical protein